MSHAVIYLAGGCFWGLEQYLSVIPGVEETQVGYANGRTPSPTYEEVCNLNTGHAETVRAVYDTQKISLPFLLELYYQAINPTSLNRQGGDIGSQYRTGIYYTRPEELPVIQASIAALQSTMDKRVAIEVKPLDCFFPAEEYHQRYLEKNPNGYCHIGAKQFQAARRAVVDSTRYDPPDREELRGKLTPLQYGVTQRSETEPPFRNDYWNHFEKGIYVDITTGEPLFAASDQFDSGCGWPSFSKPIDPNVVKEKEDLSHGMIRTEVTSRVGKAHLGHVFPDGPREKGGLRYCINSASLRFIPESQMEREGYGYLLPLPPSQS